jgi:hypothetical protein
MMGELLILKVLFALSRKTFQKFRKFSMFSTSTGFSIWEKFLMKVKGLRLKSLNISSNPN